MPVERYLLIIARNIHVFQWQRFGHIKNCSLIVNSLFIDGAHSLNTVKLRYIELDVTV